MKASPSLKSLSITAAVTLGGAAVFWAGFVGTDPAGPSLDPLPGERKSPVRPGLSVRGEAVRHAPGTSAPSSPSFPAGHRKPGRTAPAADSPPAAETSSGTAGAELQPSEAVAIESPGAQLTVSGQSVTVESFSAIPGAPGPALTVIISPSPNAAPPPPRTGPHADGFTREDELFRTKWGWAAHEAVRRAARDESVATR